MTLQLHRPDGKGGVEPVPANEPDWRHGMVSPRWGLNRRKGELPAMRNPEMNPTSTALAVLFWVGLGALTFAVLVVGYATGFWY
jgi:hypothetical protein